MKDGNFEENWDDSFSEDQKQQVVDFVKSWDLEDPRNPFETVDILYGVPEEIAKEWYQEDPEVIAHSIRRGEELLTSLQTLAETLKKIKSSIADLESQNESVKDIVGDYLVDKIDGQLKSLGLDDTP